ncbi:hypothetical protein LTR72_011684 [Exophiala xenobiotica]|nr:hypothetical protein LTR92_011250 [Exophiala xenobiotica]KAK5215249.1 hypothetical protein LTR72_011684 [Exophiala xenobiotica]KAK5284623.1 hypothetical protein LTR14_011621 [Exophiala xenobiotica]KAK5466242.1 casein kinase I [Exophiala xenobiotica]
MCGNGDLPYPDRGSSSTVHIRAVTTSPPQLLGTWYMLVYFIRGRLPWQGLKAKRDTKYLLVLEKKQDTSAHDLCAGLPAGFEEYMNYVHNLRDEDQPDYPHLRNTFNKLFRREGFEYDNVFDWTIREFLGLEPDPLRIVCIGRWNGRPGEEAMK